MGNLKHKVDINDAKIAISFDALLKFGGAERTLEELIKEFPQAVIYTVISDSKLIKERFPNTKVVNSFIQYLPFEKFFRREFYLLYPLAYRLFSFWNYDVVISVSAGFAKFVKPWRPSTKHIAYILTPPRFFWMHESRSTLTMEKASFKFYSFFIGSFLEKIWQYWDKSAAAMADFRVSISKTIQERVKNLYGLDSDIIFPPVPMDQIKVNKDIKSRKEWFLYHGRLETYKGVELVIRACVQTNSPLIVSGFGTEYENLIALTKQLNATDLIKFIGFTTDEEYRKLFHDCRAFIFPAKNEDFGIVAVEANAAGAPVLGLKQGGTMETISEANPKTGIFIKKFDVESIVEAINEFKPEEFDPMVCRKYAEQFSAEIFRYKFKSYVENVLRNR
jgi:glycosyltransferase involved in cell wall biosynthesis